MKINFYKISILLTALIMASISGLAQQKGSLFIIGGGERPPALMQQLVTTAQLKPGDYIVVLPMATSIPEESVAYFSKQLSAVCSNPVTAFNFTKAQANDHSIWIDSVTKAKLIYITGGDQNKFMDVVKDSRLYHALHQAYRSGATISGTSAGAAVMSQIMITGSEKGKTDKDSFREIKSNSVITSAGMGFLTKAIIDQHFIFRSRYNRLLSVLSDHPDKMAIGIDEATAIIVTGNKATVAGESQVLVVSNPKKIKRFGNDKVAFKDARISLFAPGESFTIK